MDNFLPNNTPYEPLTRREKEILSLVVSGITNREIAEELFIAHSTVRWFLRQIYSKLGAKDRVEAIKIAKQMDLGFSSIKHNLPLQISPFIGREQELTDLDNLLNQHKVRLLTIFAPGGMGKTQLALEAARRQVSKYADGVYFISLAPLRDASQIVGAIADTLKLQIIAGREPKEQLLNYLSHKQILLILDNFEHLLEGVSLVNDLLQVAPKVSLIVTSRQKLALSNERVYPIRGMLFPESMTVDDLGKYDAIELFLQSAMSANALFQPTSDDMESLVRICQMIEGMPLAIKLIATWVDVLSLKEIIDEIQQSIAFLQVELKDIPRRHWSIRAVFEPTWNRLSSEEKNILMKFAVFRNGCTREAAQMVTQASLRHLQIFINRALLTRTQDGRYQVHELLRQYLMEHLHQSNQFELTLEIHMQYFANVSRELIPDLKGRKQVESHQIFLTDFANFRRAWQYACDRQNYDALVYMAECLVLVAHIDRFPPMGELFNYMDNSLLYSDNLVQNDVRNQLRAWQLYIYVHYSYLHEPILDQIEDCITIAEASNNQVAMILSYVAQGDLSGNTQDLPHSYLKALHLSKYTNDSWLIGIIYHSIIQYFIFRSPKEDPVCLDYLDQYLKLMQQSGDLDGLANASFLKALWQDRFGTVINTELAARKANEIYNQTNNHFFTAMTEGAIAVCVFWQGKFDEADAHLSSVIRYYEEVNHTEPLFYTILGMLKAIQGHSKEGLALLNIAGMHTKNIDDLFLTYVGIAICQISLKDYPSVRSAITSALELDLIYVSERTMLNLLLPLSYVYAYKQHNAKAVELLSLVQSSDQDKIMWMEDWEFIDQFKSTLNNEIGEDKYEDAWKRGRTMDLKTVFKDFIDKFKE